VAAQSHRFGKVFMCRGDAGRTVQRFRPASSFDRPDKEEKKEDRDGDVREKTSWMNPGLEY